MSINKIKPIFTGMIITWFVIFSWKPIPALWANPSNYVSSPNRPEAVPVLSCDGAGNGGDRISSDGIRFVVDKSFSSIEVRLASTTPQTVTISAELRNSDGFTGQPIQTITDYTFPLNSTISSSPPYQPVPLTFSPVSVTSTQTFTLKLLSANTSIYLEVNRPDITCPDALITINNTLSNPDPIGSPIGFKVLAPDPQTLSLNSAFSTPPPRIDGSDDLNEWQAVSPIQFDNGTLSAVNDNDQVYFFVDLTGEPVDNPDDGFALGFDVNNDKAITPNVDKLYQMGKNTGNNLRYAYYPNISTLRPDTFSSRGKGFGCFVGDGTLSLNSTTSLTTTCQNHRIWEIAINLKEINAAPGQTIYMAFQVSSTNPAFTNTLPVNGLTDFSNLIAVNLAPAQGQTITQDAGTSVILDSQPFEVTQAIQDRNDTIPLVAQKRTIARVYAKSTGNSRPQPARVYLYGSYGGVDLVGSPLTTNFLAPTAVDRNHLANSANFILPSSWTNNPNVTFTAEVIDQLNHVVLSTPKTIPFTTIPDPNYWIVPINTGSSSNPVLPADNDINLQENYLSTVYPVKNINFIQQTWEQAGVQTTDTVLDALNNIYNAALMAYQSNTQFITKAPFIFPDQIIGITPSGVGQADPIWAGGSGKIAYSNLGSSQEASLAHMLDHNLDQSTTGTWGRNIPDNCGTQDTDPQWSQTDASINETGLDTRTLVNAPGSVATIISPTVPDFMSHCQSGSSPTQWISPYRWKNLLTNYLSYKPFRPTAITNVYYFSGWVGRDSNQNISGNLNKVIVQPGSASVNPSTGNYSIQLLDTNGVSHTMVTFPIQFMDDPEESIDKVYFNFQVPVSSGPNSTNVTDITLKYQSSPLSEIPAFPNDVITLNITSPKTGDNWSGIQAINWNSTNNANLTLSYTLLYTADGNNWLAVASGINATKIQIDTSSLPGSQNATARFRLIATDGFTTSQVDSGLFTMAIKPPTVQIDFPQSNQYITPGAPITLSGRAIDVQDGLIAGDTLVWTEGNTFLGKGSLLTVGLSSGVHTLTLNAINSEGKQNSTSVDINIEYPVYFPVINGP